MKYITNKDKLLKEQLIEDLFFKMKLLNSKNYSTNSNIKTNTNQNNDYNYIKLL